MKSPAKKTFWTKGGFSQGEGGKKKRFFFSRLFMGDPAHPARGPELGKGGGRGFCFTFYFWGRGTQTPIWAPGTGGGPVFFLFFGGPFNWQGRGGAWFFCRKTTYIGPLHRGPKKPPALFGRPRIRGGILGRGFFCFWRGEKGDGENLGPVSLGDVPRKAMGGNLKGAQRKGKGKKREIYFLFLFSSFSFPFVVGVFVGSGF